MDTKARAEQGLHESLAHPRISMDKTGYVSASLKSESLFAPSSTSTAPPTTPTPTLDMTLALAQKAAQAIRAQQQEIESVAILQSDPMSSAQPYKFAKLEKKQEQKRKAHDFAYKEYRRKLRDLSDEIEDLYVAEAASLKSTLVADDDAVGVLFKELNVDENLRMEPYTYVTSMWERIEAMLKTRTTTVTEFGEHLKSFEITRSETLAQYLRTMVDTMVNIGLLLPQEIERVAEVESFECNAVIIGNLRQHAELMARMEKEDILERVEARRKWEARLSDWRDLRHQRGIMEFQRDITADNFTNPPSRVATFEAFKTEQMARHEIRCEVLKRLGVMTNDTLASTTVDNIRTSFHQLNATELQGIKSLYDDLTKIKHEKHDEAERRREALRAELHNYGALHLEPDAEGLAARIDGTSLDVTLEEFFRKSGGLKSELTKISHILRDPNLIYEGVLKSGVTSASLVISGFDLEETLEKQGKSSQRKSAQDTLERLRKATKSECLPILPLLKQQATNLAIVNDIDPLLKKELSVAADQLQNLIDTANFAAEKPKSPNPDATGGTPALSKAPSESNRSRSSSRRRSVSVAPSKGWEEPELDMLAVRSIQKQVGMLIASCELDDEFKETLRETLVGMGEKAECNKLLDATIGVETTEPIAQRDYEFDSLIDWVESSLSKQSIALNSGAEKICSFYHNIAKILEMHREKEVLIDEEAQEELFNHKEDFRLENDVREKDQAHAADRLRHAADEAELEQSFTKALELLDLIESEYRVYHGTATKSTNKHPVIVDDEHRHFTFLLCSRFGLVPPKFMKFPTESLDMTEKKQPEKNATIATSVEEEKKEEEQKVEVAKNEEETPADPEASEVDGEERIPSPTPPSPEPPALDDASSLWTEDIADILTLTSHYEYGIKIAPCDMVSEILAPPPVEEEDDSAPRQMATPTRTVKTAEELEAVEQARIEAEEQKAKEEEEKKKAAKGKKGKKAAPVEELEVEPEDLSEPVFFDDSTGFVLMNDDEIVRMSESDRNAYIENHDNCFIPLQQDEIDRLLLDETFELYAKAVAEINVRRATKARIMEEAKLKADSIPVDKDETPCVVFTLLPSDTITDYVDGLKKSLLCTMEDESSKRKVKMDDLCEERKEDFTEELDERLRLHWPRKGRTETKFRQPREGELVAHRQKSARFLRGFYKRMDEQEANFADLAKEIRGHADDFVFNVEGLMKTLPDQGSLATLQGVEMKAKKFLTVFKVECEEFEEILEQFLGFEPTKLGNTISELLRLTMTFDNNGDYDLQEVIDLKELLVEPKLKLDTKVEERVKEAGEVKKYEDKATKSIPAFKAEYERCLQELSLREGLGKKYGAPRRNAQERLRTEVTRDECSAINVDKLLDKLERLCRVVKGGKAVRMEEGEEEAEDELERKRPLSVRLKHVMLSSRAAIMRRVKYLEFNSSSEEVIGAEKEIGQDTEEKKEGVEWEGEDAIIVGTFEQAIKKLQDACKQETYDLYAGEGKTDLLGEAGVPESLGKWLENNWIKVMGVDAGEICNEGIVVCVDGKDTYTVKYLDGLEEKKVPSVLIGEVGGKRVKSPEPPVWAEGRKVEVRFQCHREKARRRLRSQVERLEEILAKTPVPPNPTWLGAPSAVVVDVMRRCKKESEDLRRRSEGGFKKLLDVWEGARLKHMSSLRPQLGSPDAAGELEKLCAKEKKRGGEVAEKVGKFKTKLLAMEAENCRQTVERLVSVVGGGLMLLDNMVLRDDLLSLPGDEMILPKRKSLKRLRKAAHGASGEDEGGAEEGGNGGRKWGRRTWEKLDLEDMQKQMMECMVVVELSEEEKEEKERERAEKEKAAKKGKKGSVGGEEELGGGEDENEVEKWAREIGGKEFESFVTTAHRCLVKKCFEELKEYSTFYRENSVRVEEHFSLLEDKERAWSVKWDGLVKDLVSMEAGAGAGGA